LDSGSQEAGFRVALSLTRPTGRVGSGQDGPGTQIWGHEIKLVIKCCRKIVGLPF